VTTGSGAGAPADPPAAGSPTPSSETPPPTSREAWAAVWALIFGLAILTIDGNVMGIATPVMMRELHTDITAMMWTTSAYLLAGAVPLLIAGRVGDWVGPKILYLLGMGLFIVGSVASGLAPTVEVLIATRALQGFAAAIMAPQTMAILIRLFAPNKRGTPMGLWGAVGNIAGLFAPLLGGALVDSVGWRWIFYINVPIGIAGILIGLKFIPHFVGVRSRVDWLGTVLYGFGVFFLVFAIMQGRSYDWGTIAGPLQVWMVIAVGAVLLVLFVWRQHRLADPILPLRLFRIRNFSLGSLSYLFAALLGAAVGYPIMYFLQIGEGISAFYVALLTAPLAIVGAIMSPIVGKLADTYDPKWLAVIGAAIVSASMLWMHSLIHPGVNLVLLVIAMALGGVGFGALNAPITIAATAKLAKQDAGAGSGVMNTVGRFGSVFGTAATTAVIGGALAIGQTGDATTVRALPAAEATAFAQQMATAMWVSVACAIAILVTVLCLAPIRRPVRRTANLADVRAPVPSAGAIRLNGTVHPVAPYLSVVADALPQTGTPVVPPPGASARTTTPDHPEET